MNSDSDHSDSAAGGGSRNNSRSRSRSRSSSSSSRNDAVDSATTEQQPDASASLLASASSSSSSAAAASSVAAMASSIRPLDSPPAEFSPSPSDDGMHASLSAPVAAGWSSGESLTDSLSGGGGGLFSSSDEDDAPAAAAGHVKDEKKEERRSISGAGLSFAAMLQQQQPQSQSQPPPFQVASVNGDSGSIGGAHPSPFRHLPASVYGHHMAAWTSRAAESDAAAAAASAGGASGASLPLTAENLKHLGSRRFYGDYYGAMLNCEEMSSSEGSCGDGFGGGGCGRDCSCSDGGSARSSVCSCVCSLGEACLCCNADVLPDYEAEEDSSTLDQHNLLVDFFGDNKMHHTLANGIAQTLVGLIAPLALPRLWRLLRLDWATKPSLMQPSLEQM